MTRLYKGGDLWELSFDSNVKFEVSEDEINEIIDGFMQDNDSVEKLHNVIAEQELELEELKREKITLTNDVIKLQKELDEA